MRANSAAHQALSIHLSENVHGSVMDAWIEIENKMMLKIQWFPGVNPPAMFCRNPSVYAPFLSVMESHIM